MKNIIPNSAILLTLFFVLFASCSKTNRFSQPRTPAYDFLDGKIASWVDSGYYDGAAVKIVCDGNIAFEANYGGYSDTTPLHVASAGKWVAAAVVAALVDEGKLSWDDKVNTYLPQFTDIKGEATLRQLFSHTAGYPDYQPEGARRDDYQTLEEAVAHIVNLPADTLPGVKFRYGGLAMQVAGRMAEVATGKNWEALFQEKIAGPLEMKYSAFCPVSEEPGFNPMIGGGFRTCVSDYLKFLEMFSAYGLYKGKIILSEESVGEIESDQIGSAVVKHPEFPELVRQNDHQGVYGLGVMREEVGPAGNSTLISSPGWAGAYPWIDRETASYGFIIAKVNGKAFSEGFSSFLSGPVIPLIVRDAIAQKNYPGNLKSGRIDIGGAALYYEEMGKGEPLIFVHGHSLSHRMWDEQFFDFAKTYRAIRYDIRGYGYSSAQTETDQFTHVEDLVKLMDALKVEKAHIVGLSLGGYIGADMLGWFPQRIRSVVLASGNVRKDPKPSIPMDAEEAAKRDAEISALKKKGVDVMKREWFAGLMNSGGSRKERMRRPLWSMVYQWDAWQPLHKEVRLIAGGDAFDQLKANQPDVPTLILEGASEGNRYPKDPEILKYLPNGKIVLLEDCGHMMNMEQPAEFNRIVLNFIADQKP